MLYEILAKKICSLFPTGGLEIYYVEPKTEGPQQKISKGKIPDSFRNKLRVLRDLDVLPNKRRKSNDNENLRDARDSKFS